MTYNRVLLICLGILFVFGGNSDHASAAETLSLKCAGFSLALDNQGRFESLKDGQGKERLLKSIASPLLRLKTYSKSELENPKMMTWVEKDGFKWLTLKYEKSSAVIKVQEKGSYVTFELSSLKGEEAELVFWGPYHLNFKEQIAESLGVVYDDDFAIGIMGLNIKTCGGYKTPYDSYRGTVAVGVNGGAKLQAHTRNRTRPGVFDYGNQKHIAVLPIEGETPIGSKLAFYGVPSKELVPLIGKIEIEEGLPHPMHEGSWLKTSSYATSSKLITNFKESTFDEFLDLAEAAGISCVYQPNIFRTWGTYEIDRNKFPGGMAALKQCVAKAKKRGITLGTHTLTNFIHTTDPLVTPVPHQGLIHAGVTHLGKDLDAKATVVVLAETAPIEAYDITKKGQAYVIRVGDELIEYSARSKTRPWKLTGCKRGAFGTKIASHKAGVRLVKLVSQGYGVFLPTISLQDEMAAKLAQFFNASGFERLSFDGLEGCLRTGHGRYAEERFFKVFFDHLDNKNIIINSSQLPHFAWHYTSNESWGEPWSGGFRASMLDHRLGAQKFMVRNKLPSKLGQFRIGNNITAEDIDWVMNLCAGLNSGVDFYIEPSILTKNPEGANLVAAIKRWETSRLKGIFTEAEKAELRKPNTIFTLVESGGQAKLKFVKDWVKEAEAKRERKLTLMKGVFGSGAGTALSDDFSHINQPREPGQPTAASWLFENDQHAQPLQFVMRSPQKNKQIVREAYIKVGAIICEIPFEVRPGEYVVAAGDGRLVHVAPDGKRISEKPIKDLALSSGKNLISFNTQRVGDEPGPLVLINLRTCFSGYSLTTGKPATSSNNSPNTAFANDGKKKYSKENWSASSANKPWWQVDLGRPTSVRRIVVLPYQGERYYQYTVQSSLDGKDWMTIIDQTENTSLVGKDGYSFEFTPTKTRYLRVNMLKHSLNGGVHLVELMAY